MRPDEVYDLRSYLALLEAQGQLVRIRRPVSIIHEAANIGATCERMQQPAPLFENIYEEDPARPFAGWRLFSSALAHPERVALALGCARHEITATMARVLDPANAVPPVRVSEAPWKRNLVTDPDKIDVRALPIPKHAVGDGGRFITGGVVISKHPETGIGNLSYNRMAILGPRTFGININQWRDLQRAHAAAEAKGKPLGVAVAIGLDPALMIAAGCKYEGDETNIAGAIRGRPIEVTRGVTVDVDTIPAHAELVLEGHLLPGVRRSEGPLAEFHGYYGEPWDSPVFEVTAIGWRDQPIYQTIVPGWHEHIYIGNVLPREPLLMRFVSHASKNVKAVHIPPYANGFLVVVQLARKTNMGEPRNVALAAFAAHPNFRVCVVVDADVDLYDPSDLVWALITRVDWGQDVFTVPRAQGHEMDPANDSKGIGTKIGIDATFDKGRRPYGERVSYPMVELAKYLGM
ncbi:MAG: UbiD family decarboxylase [Thermoflexales bacterium]|nr:UbiD family decarboxylase [Thermoflexales bacterium]MCS7324508.1 UbiD family decarboxylase [Thermoflexales bacterium]MDW8054235.1 UbiD family decarboxylase [Anaerolineae bacterium]MDW8292245.1 UbiD family decarboxylase [Anaerolineae bacterium]